MTTKIHDSRAVVTGAGSGLGRALALELARRGGRVLLADVNLAAAEEVAEEARTETQRADAGMAFACDVTEVAAVEALAKLADERLGGVDVVVNNAGVAVGGQTGEVPLEDWRFIVDVNLWGVIHGCHVFLPRLRRQGSGFVLNVASAAGLLAPPQMAPYNVTKAAVVALSETLHAELRAEGIHVTVLCPTFFRTNINKAARGPSDDQRALVEGLMDRSRVQAPEVANAALEALAKGQLYAVPMWDGATLWWLKRAMPSVFARLAGRVVKRLGG